MYKLGIDIGGTKFNLGLLDENQQIVFKHAEKLPKNAPPDTIMEIIKTTLDSQLKAQIGRAHV